MALPLLDENEEAVIGHPLRIKNAVEMVAFMLHDARMKALDLALDLGPVRRRAAIADAGMARHRAAQPRHRKAAFPAKLHRPRQCLDDGVDEDCELLRGVA